MFLIRQAKMEDIGTLLKLAKMVHFINLPSDKDIITGKVLRSQECFLKAALGDSAPERDTTSSDPGRHDGSPAGLATNVKGNDVFMFVLEDTETGVCLGTSQILARMGGPGNPNFSFKLSRREFFSHSLQTGTSHIVARLHADETGPTEIGGLILQLASRGNKLGRFLSLIRFHFMGLYRGFFSDRVIAEMMGPITLDGQNMLWEYLGRRFIPLSYTEADKHCQRSREFISALLPREEIYLSLLPPEARDVVGKVHEETIPARRMLEKLGFRCEDTVDPFDGGPHLQAITDDISIVKATRRVELGDSIDSEACSWRAFVSVLTEDGEFRALDTPCTLEAKGRLRLPREALGALGVEAGVTVGFTRIDASKGRAPARVKRAKKAPRSGGKSRR